MISPEIIDSALLRKRPLPWPTEGSKEHRGQVTILGGSREVPGAVLLAGLSALRSGAGKLQVATVESCAGQLGYMLPEALIIALRETRAGGLHRSSSKVFASRASDSHAILLGPGMLEDEDADTFI